MHAEILLLALLRKLRLHGLHIHRESLERLASANRCMEKEQVQVDSPFSDRMVDFFAAYAIDIIESFMPFSIPE